MAHQKLQIGAYSLYLEETNSTNDALKLWYERESIPEGSVVYTSYQTEGRGQQGAVWESQPGMNILMSVLLEPGFLQADEQVWLNICVSCAIQQVLEDLSGLEVFIKWPNDIFIRDKKIAGMLIENVLQGSRLKYSIIGIGLNLNQAQYLPPGAASIFSTCNKNYDPNAVRSQIQDSLTHFYGLLKTKQWDKLWNHYHDNLYAKGQLARFESNGFEFEGEIMGIDKRGKLHLLVGDDVKSFANKEIRLIRILETL